VLLDNDGGFAHAFEFPGTTTSQYPWILAESGSERLPKTVYVRFKGTGVDASHTFSDDIILDQTAPAISDARVRDDTLLVAARDATSGVAGLQLRFSRHGKPSAFKRFARSTSLHGRIPRFVRVRDRAANVSRWRAVNR
jgi:hypothetical protein